MSQGFTNELGITFPLANNLGGTGLIFTKPVVNYSYSQVTGTVALSTAIPFDTSVPTSSEGIQVITVDHQAKAVGNILRIQFCGNVYNSGTANVYCTALFLDSGASATGVSSAGTGSSAGTMATPLVLDLFLAAASTSSVTYKIRVGGNNGGGVLSTNYGASNFCQISVLEYAP